MEHIEDTGTTLSWQLLWALQGPHTRNIALSQAHQGFQCALASSSPHMLKSIAGLPQRPCSSSNSTGSDSPTCSDLVLGLSRGPGTHHELGASMLFSLGTHREQTRGSNGSDDTVGSAGRGAEILGSCPLGLPEVDEQVNVPHSGRRDMEGRWARENGCRGASKPLFILVCLPHTGVLACLEFLGCILYVPSPSPTDPPRTIVCGCEMSVLWRAAGSPWLVNRGNTEAPPQLHPLLAMWQLPRSSPLIMVPYNSPAQFPLPLPVLQQQGKASTAEVALCNYSPTLPCTHP